MLADHHSRNSQRDLPGSDPMAEHKRRARWRLVGAIILAGAVAAVAPFFLEEQARPLSDDLLVELPARPFSFTKSNQEARVDQAPLIVESSEDRIPAAPAAPAALPPLATTKAPTSSAAPTPPAALTPASAPTAPAKRQLMVQVGAYATVEAANRVKSRLEAGGNRVVVETITNAEGLTRYRVRIGPFEKKEQAIEVRDRAKAQGYDAALVRS